MPVLGTCAQGESSSWPTIPGADMRWPPGAYPDLAEVAPRKNGQSDAVFLQDVKAFADARDVRGRSGKRPSLLPIPVHE